jgi:hypothetical protein
MATEQAAGPRPVGWQRERLTLGSGPAANPRQPPSTLPATRGPQGGHVLVEGLGEPRRWPPMHGKRQARDHH